ncbi:TTN [Lepeophtheirus salmonis]|uniref:TTN n=1 Tax=Lepeophtheirus salmonis TaxID=72036 RepID=A0A7R8CK69_LEPSM|nr:TTN [Lepeophtheirus salmonis]CAF2845746.1 TTN [Lepeophtheirus salmonis]
MGNSNSSSNRGRHGDSKGQQKSDSDSKSESKPSVILPTEPGRPIVKLTKIKTDASELTDEITLKWKGPSRRGNVKIQGYLVEMWDLGMNEWVRVVGTDDPGVTECRLSNILSGMLYRFRVSAVTDAGLSLPSLPSEAFVINIPGVNIAPYWVTTPNHNMHIKSMILFTLGWKPLALLTQISTDNLQPEDVGVLRCSAVNTIGRINWETKINLISPPEFDVGGLRRKYRFREDEIIRIKCPLISIPKPDVRVYRRENEMKILMESGFVLIQSIDNIVESVPKIPSRPTVEVGLTDVMLSWDHDTDNNSAVRYLIEYYRDQWALWLKAKYSNTSENILVSDLIPGSYYKFRVKAINNSGNE